MAQDFFGTRREGERIGDDVDKFAKAISQRSVLNPAMNPKALAPTNPTNPPPSTTIKPSSSFAFIEPKDLSPLINNSSALIIDIRPHAAYSSARIPTALSLSVPSTLLKRPLFSLDRLGAMLPSSSSRSRFSEWPKFSTILVYDVDSTGSPFLPEGSNILGLLRKFSNDAAYSGSTLLWLKGGFQRVWRECRDLVDFRPPDPEAEEDSNESGSLKTAHLSSKAFGSGTTTRNSLDMFSPQKRPPSTLSLRSNAPQMSDKINVTSSIPFNPFFDTIRQNIELTQGITERIPLRLPKRVLKRINDLPFEWLREISRRADRYFARHRSTDPAPKHLDPPPPDQTLLEQGMEALAQQFYHIELAEQKRLMGVMKHHSAESDVISRAHPDRKDTVDPAVAPEHRPGNLCSEDVENASGRGFSVPSVNRPTGSSEYVRNRKSSQLSSISSGRYIPPSVSESDSDRGGNQKFKRTAIFPYSITAGVEKGAKNRYRHIWPFEHARVRLHLRRHSPPRKPFQPADPDSFISLPTNLHSTVSFPSLPPSSAPSIRPSGALTGPISSFSTTSTAGASISRSASDAARSPRPSSRMNNRRGVKPSFGTGGLGAISSSNFNFSSPALTAPLMSGFSSSAIGGSAFKPSFTRMRAPAPAAGSGGETTESEHEPDDSEKENSGREEQEDHDDYVNASYVQPLCTTRRYIATQGPLEATFVDFWTLVYQQNVHVIVMLTREIEGSMVKCGPYWKDEVFGPLRLKLISVEGNDSEGKDDDVRRKIGGGDPEASGFFFNAPTSMPDTKTKKVSKNPADAIIKRTFLLSHTGYPDIPPRKVVQFQYLEWPDMNVPDDPRGVLGLIREVDQAVTEAMHLNGQGEKENETEYETEGISNNVNAGVPAIIRPSLSGTRRESEESLNRFTGIANNAVGRKHSPVLLHCSAGVGRTGGFIAVDAVLDGLRRELRKKKKLGLYHGQGTSKMADTMHIDEASRNRAVQDGQGNWNWIGNTDVDMKDSRSDLHTIAIPANHRGNILHVPVHHPSTVRYSYLLLAIANRQESNDGLSTPTAPFPVLHASQDSTSAAVSAEASINPSPPSRDPQLKTPMQVDQDFTSTKSIPPYPRQSSTTRMWAEDVSDQTGSHGTAYRVDDAMRRMYSQERLSEWDIPITGQEQSGTSNTRTASENPRSMEVNVSQPSIAIIPLASGPKIANPPLTVVGSAIPASVLPSAFPLSSIDSASSSDDSYGFRSNFKGGRHHRFGHHVTGSLPHGSAVPQSTISQVKDGDQLPARNVRGEEARVRTWSAPSARFSQSETDQLHGLRHSASPFTSSPLVMGDRSRAVEKSPSPVPHFLSMMGHDDSASLPPLSRSLSPSNRPNSSLTVDNQLSSITMDSSREGMVEPSSMLPDEPQAFPVSAKNLTLPTSHPNLAANSTPSVNVIRTPTTNGTSLQSRSGTLSGDAIPNPTHNQGTGMQDVDQQILASRNGDPHSSPDLSYPRPLHNDQSPQALSSLDEPLMEVLQDMREQRMSLCQSLRQYVFVHAAVIEGALMIVDEEREREKKEMGMDIDDSPFINQSAGTQSVPEASSLSSPKQPRLRSKDAESSASAPSTGKRLASPTELPKEDRKGDQMLFKRP
ncbi:hypothetical protein C8R42DRAFT_684230, partial [Lentinula raphanica]